MSDEEDARKGEEEQITRKHEREAEVEKVVKRKKIEVHPDPFIDYRLINDEVRDACITFGKLRAGKGAAADVVPIIWDDKKFREMLKLKSANDKSFIMPIYSLSNTKQLSVNHPWMKFSFGYKPSTKVNEDGKESTSNTLRMEYGKQAAGDNLEDYHKWLRQRDLWYIRKAFENQKDWGKRFQNVLQKQLRTEDGEKVIDLVKHVQHAWKWTEKSDTGSTLGDGLNFNLETQTTNEVIGAKADKNNCALVVWGYDRKPITKVLTRKNAIDCKDADAVPIIQRGMYGKPCSRESHIAICPERFGLTSVMEEVRIANESQLFTNEVEVVCNW